MAGEFGWSTKGILSLFFPALYPWCGMCSPHISASAFRQGSLGTCRNKGCRAGAGNIMSCGMRRRSIIRRLARTIPSCSNFRYIPKYQFFQGACCRPPTGWQPGCKCVCGWRGTFAARSSGIAPGSGVCRCIGTWCRGSRRRNLLRLYSG